MAETVQINYMRVYDTYANLLAETNPSGLAWVADASEDSTVGSGAALYYWKNGSWVKKYEMEMMDRPSTVLTNLNVVKKISAVNGNLFYDGVRVARISDVAEVVNDVAAPIIAEAVDIAVGPIVAALVQDSMAEVISDLNEAIGTAASGLRGEFAAADSNTLSTANSNIATAKSEVLAEVIKSASSTNAIVASVNSETRDLTMALKISTVDNNMAEVSSDGLFVAKELPVNAVNNDIAVFNGTTWVKMALSSIPSTLRWTTV